MKAIIFLKIYFGISLFIFCCNSLLAQEVIAQKRYGGSNSDAVNTVIPTKDKGYLILASSKSGISGDKTDSCFGSTDIWLLKFTEQDTLEWQKTIGGDNIDDPVGAFQMEDGGFLILAFSLSGKSGNKTVVSKGATDYWLLKLDKNGTIAWQKSIGGDGDDTPSIFIQTADGNYLAGGSSASGISGDKTEKSRGRVDLWVVKIDMNGKIMWDKTFGGNHDDVLAGGLALKDSTFTISATSLSGVNGDKTVPLIGGDDIWVININAQGKINYQNALGTHISDKAARAIVEVNTGTWVSGNIGINTGAKPQIDPAIYLLDRRGQLTDSFIFEADQDDFITAAAATYDGGLLSAIVCLSGKSGIKSETSRGRKDLWLVRLDKNKKLLWDKTFGGIDDETTLSFIEHDPGQYLITCSSSSPISGDIQVKGEGGSDIYILKLTDQTVPKCFLSRWWKKVCKN